MARTVVDPNGDVWIWADSEWYRDKDVWKPDVLIAGKLIEDRKDVGAKIEIFSKTDQYQVWVAQNQWYRITEDKPLGTSTYVGKWIEEVKDAHRP